MQARLCYPRRMRWCPECETDKPLSEYAYHTTNKKHVLNCRDCVNSRRRELASQRRDIGLRKDNNTGARGVAYFPNNRSQKKYRAKAHHNGKQIHLGWFEDVLDAICAASDYRIVHGLNRDENVPVSAEMLDNEAHSL